jgi:hypothetical protein
MAAGKLSFTQTEFRVREDGTYIGAKVSVERTVGTTGIVSVKVTNSSASSLGRGTRKLDFLPINSTTSGSAQLLTWADGESGIKTLEFTIIQENLVEGDEFVPLSLGSFKGGAVAGEIPKCNLIIVDDDGLKGDKGDIGIQGEKGDKGEAGAGLKWKGNWVYGNYEVGDLVNYFDAVEWAVYICVSKPIINYPIGLPLNDYYGYEDSSIFPNVSPSWELFCKGTKGLDGRDYNITYKGEWSPTTLYVQREAVLYQGSSYLCIKENGMGRNPVLEPTFWTLIAKGFNRQSYALQSPTTQGGMTSIVHGLNAANILGFSASLFIDLSIPGVGFAPRILPGGLKSPGFYYDVIVDSGNIIVYLNQDSANVLNKKVTVLIETV